MGCLLTLFLWQNYLPFLGYKVIFYLLSGARIRIQGRYLLWSPNFRVDVAGCQHVLSFIVNAEVTLSPTLGWRWKDVLCVNL